MSKKIGIVILAAGQGSRMKMDLPKPLAPVLGNTLVDYSLRNSLSLLEAFNDDGHVSLVVGHQRELVKDYISEKYKNRIDMINYALQKNQKGTADALKSYFNDVETAKTCEYTMVLCADTPLIKLDDLKRLVDRTLEEGLEGMAATFNDSTPYGYGRIVRSKKHSGFHIVEEKDATAEEREITEVNSGVYFFKTEFVLENLFSINSENNSGEYYLTDLFQDKSKVAPLFFDDKKSFMGVNDLSQLEEAESFLRKDIVSHLKNEQGVRFIDSRHCYIETLNVGKGSLIYPNVFLDNESKVGINVTLEPGCIIKKSTIEEGVVVKAYSHLENVILRKNSVVGPYARLRPGADIGEESKIGNFVEIKKSKLAKGVKVSHLSYLGDAEIGSETNIGCGFITCNYDGVQKHKTKIGKNCFIGSDSQTIAPVDIGDGCFVASGTTVTNDMSDGDFAISRGKQVTKEKMARRFLKKK